MIREAMEGAAAGLTATAPMTAVMELGFKLLPGHTQYALPPRQITRVVGRAIHPRGWYSLPAEHKQALSVAAHFSYGAAAGALYGAALPAEQKNWLTGAAYGLAVWSGSYLGFLPGLGILRPATDHPVERSVLMILAHLVWGATLGGTLAKAGTLNHGGATAKGHAGQGKGYPW